MTTLNTFDLIDAAQRAYRAAEDARLAEQQRKEQEQAEQLAESRRQHRARMILAVAQFVGVDPAQLPEPDVLMETSLHNNGAFDEYRFWWGDTCLLIVPNNVRQLFVQRRCAGCGRLMGTNVTASAGGKPDPLTVLDEVGKWLATARETCSDCAFVEQHDEFVEREGYEP